MRTIDIKKKMSNAGHEQKVPHGNTIGMVFLIGLIVGGIVTFLAVAGRTQSVVEQRRAMFLEKGPSALKGMLGMPPPPGGAVPEVAPAAAQPSNGQTAP